MAEFENKKSLYSVHPSVAYTQSILNNLARKTGKSLDEWIALVRRTGLKEASARHDWLKREHKLGGTTAHLIANRVSDKGGERDSAEAYLEAAVGYVENMYAGAKEVLRPLHAELVALVFSLGGDVKISPCKTIVPVYRKHVFAEIKPATRARIDFGLCLRDAPGALPGRLIDTGGLRKGDRITRRFVISEPSDIDDEVRIWARVAYDLDS